MTTHLPDDRNVPLLPRHRLTSALSALTAHRVVIVTAPGGYGKTTLMREFVANLPGAAFCWLSLDKADASLPIFLQQLDRTLARYLPPGGVFSYSPDRVYTAQAEVRNLARMIAVGLAGHSQDRLIIVMDDLHHVGFSGPVVTFVDALIHHLPPSVHLVIACRGRPPLSMGRLQARREVVTLTAGDLSFTPDEVQRLFQQCLGLEVSDPMLRAIHAQTEGWVTALLLLGAILRPLPQADWAGMLSRFPTGGAIFDFLEEEVFAPQPNSIQDFLLSTCMLSVLHPRVIERMLGIVGAAAVLQELEARSLFITPTLSGGSAYQYHPLFRRFLQQQVKVRRGEQEERRLQVAAGQIYESLGDLAQAIEHYLAAGEFGRATPLMAEVVDALLKALRHEVVQAWLQRVPVELLDTDPDLVYTRAQLSGWLAQLDSLPVLYQRALELYELRGDHRGLCRALSWVTSRFWKLRYPYFYDSTARWMASPDPTVALYGRVLRAASRTGRGEWAEAFAELEGLLADAPPATRIYFDLLETLAVLAAWLGDPKGAIRYGLPYVTGRTALGDFAWGIYTWVSYCMLGDSLGLDAFHRQYQRMEIPPDSTQLHHIIGMLGEGIIHLYHRRYDQAMDSLEGIQPFFNDGHSVRHTMGSEATSLAQAELGRLYLRQGRVEEARACFERNVELTSGYPEMTSCAYACMAEFCAAQGDLIKARSHLAKARSGDPPGAEGMTWIWVTVVAFKISQIGRAHV